MLRMLLQKIPVDTLGLGALAAVVRLRAQERPRLERAWAEFCAVPPPPPQALVRMMRAHAAPRAPGRGRSSEHCGNRFDMRVLYTGSGLP